MKSTREKNPIDGSRILTCDPLIQTILVVATPFLAFMAVTVVPFQLASTLRSPAS